MDFLWDRIQAYSERNPHRLAILEPGRCTASYGELHAMLADVAGRLEQAGVNSAGRTAIILKDGACGLISLLGAAKVCACAPLNPASTAAELEIDLLALRASAVITAADLEIPLAVATKLGLAVVQAALVEGQLVWEAVRSRSASPVDMLPRDDDAPALLLFTSATTGRRKMVPLSGANLQAQVENSARSLRLVAEDRLLMLARLFHTQGILSPFAQLLTGGSILMTHGFTPQMLPDWLREFEPTWYTCGPTLHRAILSHVEENPLAASTSLRFIRSGGAPLDAGLRSRLERALKVPVLNVYGLSETGAVASTTAEMCASGDFGADGGAVGASVGPAIAAMSSDGVLLPAGVEGEIVVSGPTVMAGYLDDAAANREAFVGAWFRTGDLGHIDERGWLHITGRLKEIINRGGQKVIPGEVDSVLAAHPAVLEAAAFSVPHPTLGEDVACAVVLREGTDTDEVQLRAFAATQLAAFKVPRKIYRLASIPHGSTGKAQRLVLQAMFSARGPGLNTSPEPQDAGRLAKFAGVRDVQPAQVGLRPVDLEESLAGLWRKHCQAEPGDGQTDFFTAGGDSLSAVMMLSEAEDLFSLDVVLSSSTFFKEPTFATLTGMLAEAVDGRCVVSSSAMEVVPLRKGAGSLSLFMIPSDGEEGCGFRRLARALNKDLAMALVRPGNCFYERDGSLEEQAAQAVAAIVKERPEGPYLLAGYCYGGVVAQETARQLEARNARVLLILFDVPMPGYPHLVADAGIYARAAGSAFRNAWATRRAWPVGHFAGRMIRRATWSALRALHPKDTGVWSLRAMQWICAQARIKYFPYFRPGPIQAPTLHFLARHEPDLLPAESRFGWQKTGLCQTTVQWLDCSHNRLLDPRHIAHIAMSLDSFVAQHAAGTEQKAVTAASLL